MLWCHSLFIFFFFNDTATTEIYTLSLHDALPIYPIQRTAAASTFSTRRASREIGRWTPALCAIRVRGRSEEHTSELQSRLHLVCRLLLEKKKTLDDSIL